MDIEQQKEQLYKQLQTAIELELTTLPPYLTAYYSIMEHANIDAANLIREVFMEEMLHLCLAGNVFVAIGGEVTLGAGNTPNYPCTLGFNGKAFGDRKFAINLEKFSKNSVQTFRKIELPGYLGAFDGAENNNNDMQIGEFYNDIISKLEALDTSCKEAGITLFNTDTSNQITETYFWRGGGKPVTVTDIASAKYALNTIIDQGESSNRSMYDSDDVNCGQQKDLAHYFKFNEIHYEKKYKRDRETATTSANDGLLEAEPLPQGEPLIVDYSAVYPVKTNPQHADYQHNPHLSALNIKFNQGYSLMLQQIEEAFAGNPKVLYNAIMNGMHDLSPIARTMAKIKIDPENGSETGTPTFEWVQPLTASA